MRNIIPIMENLVENTNAEAAIMVNKEGLPIHSINIDDEDRLAVLISSLQSIGKKFTENIKNVPEGKFYIKTSKGYILLQDINDDVSLCLISGEDAKLGLLMLYFESTVKELAEAL